MTTSPTSALPKLAGRYKGSRRRREPLIMAECPCGWRSRPMNPRKAEKRYAAHAAIKHANFRESMKMTRAGFLLSA
jgi:hypothetical protein